MSKANPFNIPPPWNPGYAVPDNVVDEGLERHGYVTEWAPRGSFDNPKVGYAGYAVPGYVTEEPYGQGAFATRWAPRGSYAGPKVRHWLDQPSARVIGHERLPGGATKMQIAMLSGTEQRMTGGANPFTAYGMRAANALLDTVKMMPPTKRTQQLKRALDKIDPHLWGRAEQAAAIETRAGAPDDVALERGLAAAMSLGIGAELVDLGKGKAPPRHSQLGAVCYGCAALGDTAAPIPGQCSADGAFIWRAATATIPAHWERLRRGEACSGTASGVTAVVRVHESAAGWCRDAAGKVIARPANTECAPGTTPYVPPPTPPTPPDQKFLGIGPFLIPVTEGAWRDHRPLSNEKKQYVDENVAIAAKAGGVSIAEMQTGKYPFVKFKVNEESWGLYYQIKDGGTIVAYHKMPTDQGLGGIGSVLSDIGSGIKDVATTVAGAVWSVLKKIWAGIKWVAAKVVDFVKDAAEWIADKACDVVSSPIGKIGAGAVGAYFGGPAGAQAGVMGAQAAAKACAGSPKCPEGQIVGPDGKTCLPVVPPPSSGVSTPILLIGGVGLAALLFFGTKKKKTP